MAKKNPYVTTIGFNKEDPDHVYVADFLNSMGRGKGQYIVKAIMAYQNPEGIPYGQVVGVPIVDYEKIKSFVLQVLEERGSVKIVSDEYKTLKKEQAKELKKVRDMHSEHKEMLDLDETAVSNIIASLNIFK